MSTRRRLILWCPIDSVVDHPKQAAGLLFGWSKVGHKLATEYKHRRGTLLLGLLLLAAGLVLVLAPAGSGVAGWLIALWPVFLICAGVVRVMGFAVERKPRSPLVGTLLIIVGVLFLAARFQPGLNALQVYGRYWVLLLAVYASVELVRYYSHRQTEGPPPPVFTPVAHPGCIVDRVYGSARQPGSEQALGPFGAQASELSQRSARFRGRRDLRVYGSTRHQRGSPARHEGDHQ